MLLYNDYYSPNSTRSTVKRLPSLTGSITWMLGLKPGRETPEASIRVGWSLGRSKARKWGGGGVRGGARGRGGGLSFIVVIEIYCCGVGDRIWRGWDHCLRGYVVGGVDGSVYRKWKVWGKVCRVVGGLMLLALLAKTTEELGEQELEGGVMCDILGSGAPFREVRR
ncbi:hypothetical protein Tco_1316673 [Tanacetum coccineum]